MNTKNPPIDFVGIGAPRAGTTYLDALLRSNTDIHLPRDRKEVHYFDQNLERGTDWYRDTVRGAATSDKKCGEITPAYLFGEDVPKQLSLIAPDARLIVCLRDPVNRAYSHYLRIRALKGEKRPFLSLLDKGSPVYEASLYAHHIERWLEYFDRSQLLITRPETLDQQHSLNEIARHLGVSASGFTQPQERMNVAAAERSRAFIAAKLIGKFAHRHNITTILKLRMFVSDKVRTMQPKNKTVSRIEPKTYKSAASLFREDSSRLNELMGFNAQDIWPDLFT